MQVLCTICNDLVNQGDIVYAIKCGHIFHHHCLTLWMERSKSCPQCRNRASSKCIFRIFPTISNVESGEDVATLQSRLDDVNLQLRQKNISSKETEDKLASLELELKKQGEALKASERKLVSRDSAAAALKEHLEILKEQNKETEQLRVDNEALRKNLDTLNGLQKVLNATSEDVEKLLESYTDLRTVATFATSLKRALCDSETKKNEFRDKLISTRLQLSMEKKICADWQAKYLQLEETLSSIETLKNKRKASELSDNSFLEESHEKSTILHCPNNKRLFNDAIIMSNDSSSLNEIEYANSPYLNLKQGSCALASLQRTSTLKEELQPPEYALSNSARLLGVKPDMKASNSQHDVSIFFKKGSEIIDLVDDTDPNPEVNISYDGLGGHSKLETFPGSSKTKFSTWKPKSSIPKLTSKHKLKRPEKKREE